MMFKGIRLLAVAVIAGILSAVTVGLTSVGYEGMAGGMVSAAVGSVVVGLFLLYDNDAKTAAKIAGKSAVAGMVMVLAVSFVPWDIPLGALGLGGALGFGCVYMLNNPPNTGEANKRG